MTVPSQTSENIGFRPGDKNAIALSGKNPPEPAVDLGRLVALRDAAPADLMECMARMKGRFLRPPLMSQDGNLMFCESEVHAGERYICPARTHVIVVRHVSGSRGVVSLCSGVYPVDPGEGMVTVIPAGEPLYTRFTTPHRVFMISVRPTALYPFLPASGAPVRVQPRVEVQDRVICSIANALSTFIGSSTPAFMDAQGAAMAIHLLAHYCSTLGTVADQGTNRGINAVLAHLNAHAERKFQVEELAEIAGYSPFHFSRIFKASTGLSPMRYLVKLRLEKARELIEGSSMSITEISLHVGFDSPAHFSRAFRLYWKMSPSDLRRG